eukprot:6378925-Pyramimonas_sp.AAC.1
MRDLQKIPHAQPKDHCPMLWRLRYKLHFGPADTEQEQRWDRDRLASILTDGGPLRLIGELERRSEPA